MKVKLRVNICQIYDNIGELSLYCRRGENSKQANTATIDSHRVVSARLRKVLFLGYGPFLRWLCVLMVNCAWRSVLLGNGMWMGRDAKLREWLFATNDQISAWFSEFARTAPESDWMTWLCCDITYTCSKYDFSILRNLWRQMALIDCGSQRPQSTQKCIRIWSEWHVVEDRFLAQNGT